MGWPTLNIIELRALSASAPSPSTPWPFGHDLLLASSEGLWLSQSLFSSCVHQGAVVFFMYVLLASAYTSMLHPEHEQTSWSPVLPRYVSKLLWNQPGVSASPKTENTFHRAQPHKSSTSNLRYLTTHSIPN